MGSQYSLVEKMRSDRSKHGIGKQTDGSDGQGDTGDQVWEVAGGRASPTGPPVDFPLTCKT